MVLLTDEHRERLINNGRQRDTGDVPVVKFFNPLAKAFGSPPSLTKTATRSSAWPTSASQSQALSPWRRCHRSACRSA